MATILITVAIFLLAGVGLGVGVLCGRNAIKGSCGGCANCIYPRKKHD